MILCLDLGNTTTTIGILDGTTTRAFWRISTRERTEDEYLMVLRSLMAGSGPGLSPDACGISSVVPGETRYLAAAVRSLLDIEAVTIDGSSGFGVEVATENPAEVGGDRIANAVGAFYGYGAPAIVVDSGTAMTFDYIAPGGRYRGGVIAPGIMAGARDLWENARMLPAVEIRRPRHIIGTTTIACMQAGIYYGSIGQVEGIVRRMWAEIGGTCRVILTGGQAVVIKNDLGFESVYDPYLTLKGIAYAVDPGLRSKP
jgi:type III pantothenate kinase